MKRQRLLKTWSLTVLWALLVIVLLPQISSLPAWSAVSREHVMAAEKTVTDSATNLKPANPEHEVALFALG